MRRFLLSAFLYVAAVAAVGPALAQSEPGPAADQLIKIDRVVGTGAEATIGATVIVNYTGWLYKPMAMNYHGKMFDSSVGRAPFDFQLGAGRVIKGWDLGVAGMRVGGKRTLIIPGDQAYGSRGSNDIPPNAPLTFDIELLNVK